MGTLASIVAAISAEVVATLAAGGYPALVDGGIVVGTAAEFEQTSPQRIIFDFDAGSKYVPAEYYSGSTTIHTTERTLQGALRTIAGDNVLVSVHCWGRATTGLAVDDYDVCRSYAHAVRAALQAIVPGAFELTDGKYRTNQHIVRAGRWFTMNLVLFTPVLETLVAYDRDLAYASDSVTDEGTDLMLIPTTGPQSGPSEAGC